MEYYSLASLRRNYLWHNDISYTDMLIRAIKIAPDNSEHMGTVTLDYDGRFQRRRVMRSNEGMSFLLDLEKTTHIQPGDSLVLEDGRRLLVIAAEENLLKVVAHDSQHLAKLAWHIGNRHLPCSVKDGHLLIRHDHVIAEMLKLLGGEVEEVSAPFDPEGGAYGHGRTHDHKHSH